MTFMTEGDGASEILKSDKLGRVQVPPEVAREAEPVICQIKL